MSVHLREPAAGRQLEERTHTRKCTQARQTEKTKNAAAAAITARVIAPHRVRARPRVQNQKHALINRHVARALAIVTLRAK